MKKTLSTITLALVLTFGATFANAGILIGDRATTTTCTAEKDGIIVFGVTGIIVFGAAQLASPGIIVFGAADSSGCTAPGTSDSGGKTALDPGIIVFG